MSRVYIENQNEYYSAIPGETIQEALHRSGYGMDAPCNGLGKCGKCKVWVSGELEPALDSEREHLVGEEEHIRLGCMARIKGDIRIRMLNQEENLKGIQEDNQHVRVDTIDLDEETYSVAFDIGTTGISGSLHRMSDQVVVSNCSGMNPQVRFGADVLSRITYCMDQSDGRTRLQEVLVAGLNEMLEELTLGNKVLTIHKIVVSANTTMLHLLAGVDPVSLAVAPYKPVFTHAKVMKAQDVGFKVPDCCELLLMPSLSAYIGADVIGGLIVSSKKSCKQNILYLDIGTNGEIALCKQGKWAATSTAAGPALEGANIQCGCRAIEGAVESVSLDEQGNISCQVIGNKKASGLCGTGLIDLVAALLESKQLDHRGKLVLVDKYAKEHSLRDKKWFLTEDIFLSQKDVRQVQLAKGAIATGVQLLLKQLNMSITEIEEIRIAGAFGYHLNPESLLRIGLLPREYQNEIYFVGNTSLAGAQQVLYNSDFIKEMDEWIQKIEVVELSTREDFQDTFIRELQF